MRRTGRAQTFRALHRGARVLLLPNVWDAGSAAIFAAAGAEAIATSSAGIAWSCGYPDGDLLPREALLQTTAGVCRVAGDVPVSVDLESGFGDDPAAVAELALAVCELGVAGINLEDGDGNPELLVEKIGAIRGALQRAGADPYINARADVYLRGLTSDDAALAETIARGLRYRAAGADGFFVPAVSDPHEIAAIARKVDLPLNILAIPGLPDAGELYRLGVRRLSAGSATAKIAYGAAREAVRAFLQSRDSSALFGPAVVEYAETNALLARVARDPTP